MQRTIIKICGITRLQDALHAEQLGVDALGFVFVEASARHIAPADAVVIADKLAPFISRVGLFLNAAVADVDAALASVPLLMPQFHGTESPADCERYNTPYIKAIGLVDGMPSAATLSEYENAVAFLFDSNVPGQLGGTGHVFDWQKLDASIDQRVVLAGGLTVHNVADAIEQVKPYAVDVSSGVEAGRGIKNPDAMSAFVAAVAAADRHRG